MAASDTKFLTDLPRFVFFTGKGDVGKTSIACASALPPEAEIASITEQLSGS